LLTVRVGVRVVLNTNEEVGIMSSVLDRREAEDLYRRFTTKIAAATAEVAQLQHELAAMARMMDGLQQMYPDLNKEAPVAGMTPAVENSPTEADIFAAGSSRPTELSSVEIVAKVVEDIAGDGAVSVPTVFQEMKRRDWLPDATDPMAAIRTALARARSRGLVVGVPLDGRSNGYMPPTDTSGPDTSGPEGDVVTTGAGGDPHAQADQDHGDDQARRNRDDRGGAPVGGLT
jgi:hypothetical protein